MTDGSPPRRVGGVFDQVRVRVTVAATAVALVAGILGSVLFVEILRANLVQSLASSASSQIDAVVARLDEGESDRLAVVSGGRDIVVQIVRNGRVTASDHWNVTQPVLLSAGTENDVVIPGVRDTYVVQGRQVDSSTLVVVGLSQEQLGSATDLLAVLLAISVPVVTAALGAAVWLSIGRALRPVEAMRRQAAAITSEHLHRRLVVAAGSDEIPRLATTLNEMLDRIDAAHQLQRQFVADASHELRSPLASLRQLAEVARKHPDRVSSRSLAADVLAEEQRLEDLVTALLTLARLDGAAEAGREVDLDDLVRDEIARVAPAVNVSVDISRLGTGRVHGDPVLLAQAVRNLLSNALRHARSCVVVELGEDGTWVNLVIHDDGAGIRPEDREVIFERFVRLDEARAHDEGGAGLGLSIVSKVVTGTGGIITVDEGPAGGARFLARFPAVDEVVVPR